MIRQEMMTVGGDVPGAVLVEALARLTTWKPNTGLAQVGDLAVFVGQSLPSGLVQLGMIKYKFLSASDLSKTFSISSSNYRFHVAVLRNVEAITQRIVTTASNHETFAGFEKADRHAGILIHTENTPSTGQAYIQVGVGAVGSTPRIIDYYSPPAEGNSGRHLNTYLYPDFPLYQDAATFFVDGDNDIPNPVNIYELLGG